MTDEEKAALGYGVDAIAEVDTLLSFQGAELIGIASRADVHAFLPSTVILDSEEDNCVNIVEVINSVFAKTGYASPNIVEIIRYRYYDGGGSEYTVSTYLRYDKRPNPWAYSKGRLDRKALTKVSKAVDGGETSWKIIVDDHEFPEDEPEPLNEPELLCHVVKVSLRDMRKILDKIQPKEKRGGQIKR